MDPLILIRVSAALDANLRGSVLREVREETKDRFRIVLERDGAPRSLLVSLRSGAPWIGRPAIRGAGRKAPVGAFGARCSRALRGAILTEVLRADGDRRATLRFACGQALVVELSGRAANLVLLDSAGRVAGSARLPRASRERLETGSPYAPAALPPSVLDPCSAPAAAIDAAIARGLAAGLAPLVALRRAVLGLSKTSLRLVDEESRSSGSSPGAVLERRAYELREGNHEPVLDQAADPIEAAESGSLDADALILFPWEPAAPAERSRRRIRLDDAAATAGLYHEALELAGELEARRASLTAVLAREIGRLREAEGRVRADVTSFEDPARYRVWAEALLAGMARAQREGAVVRVADPYDLAGRTIAVPVAPQLSLAEAAEGLFARYRRARRGAERAAARLCELTARRARLEPLHERSAESRGREALAELERAMRGEGLAVGLERQPRSRPAAVRRVRLEGVRLYRSPDGLSILVGKTAKDNQRLTFKLASPEDFWLHALGVAGAHVVVRNDERRGAMPAATLAQAAALAAWYSDARAQGMVDVQWTRRKYVRKLRGAPPGTVTVKRAETVRVRPRLPAS